MNRFQSHHVSYLCTDIIKFLQVFSYHTMKLCSHCPHWKQRNKSWNYWIYSKHCFSTQNDKELETPTRDVQERNRKCSSVSWTRGEIFIDISYFMFYRESFEQVPDKLLTDGLFHDWLDLISSRNIRNIRTRLEKHFTCK